ncbi:uncharacterized protein BP01DRAFT_412940 [Aspergillus saccharolyticus JOP 1030-1]|uniref:RING-type domain-containing protein n=1 Tax=Aspergillus saccharolyticus JOP 1030-1 TaxID=1450539 RepID=A0A319ASC9_9EURO|nr:hypothetical protein BP01DRAFT_412940 [Aspergillus saccharolyticus JOP 1030-1]PYH49182.1 hypothetical protein BP01DRAFT_412940 [Aspergillus saccharolyticus JOP 1030-1]
MSEYKMSYEAELDSYQLYHRYEQPRSQGKDWKQAALRGPALPTLGNALAGAIGAALSNVATYPLSLIVARLQTQSTQTSNKGKAHRSQERSEGGEGDTGDKYAGVLDAARKIYTQEGLGSFYTGLAQDTAKSVLDSFLFFLAYEHLRQRRIRARFAGRRTKHTVLPVLDELVIGVIAGAFAKLFTTPLANIVARKQTGRKMSADASTREIAARILAEKGLRGFWSGYSASLILTLNPSLTFFLNEVLNYALLTRRQDRTRQKKPSPLVTFLLAAVSKSMASAVTYPFSKAKTRAQVMGDDFMSKATADEPKNSDNGETDEGMSFTPAIVSNVINIARTEGVAGLYAGLPAEVLKGFFSHGFTMLAKDAVYSAIVQSYYLLLIALRKYPSPEELIQRAREQAEEYADVAREGARELAEKTKNSAEGVMHTLTVQGEPEEANLLGNNETAEMVGDYVDDDDTSSLFLTLPMSNASIPGPGLGDLEKELTCSICTDLLYQPLTLLNCLHTFCGSCLKEWFAVQGTRSRPSSSARFTCPSCRAAVRDTRPNATVTTLLDMVLTASPDRDKSAAEKEEIAHRYKPGDSVFPPQEDQGSDEEDRRVLEEVRALSLQDTRSRHRQQQQRSRHSSRSRYRRVEGTDADSDARRREEDGRSRRRREASSSSRRQQRRAAGEGSSERSTRRVEHQSSLRSLLSLSDTETMQEEILRQIFEEGLLDDIDLDNMGPSQEEELSERIAEAYRRRHRLRARSQQRRQEPPENPQTPSSRPRARSQSVQRTDNGTATAATRDTRESNGGPPLSRPYLLDPLVARDGTSGHQRRLSDQGGSRSRRRTSPVPVAAASASEVSLRPAARSSTDVAADRPRNSEAARARTSESSTSSRLRRATASEQNVPNIWIEGARERQLRSSSGRSSIDSPRVASALNHRGRDGSWPTSPDEPSTVPPPTSSLVAEVGGAARQESRSRPSSSRSNVPPRSATLYAEPSIKCDRCDKPNIQYGLHKRCSTCREGNFHLCLRCYRTGRGCLDWAGFGASAEADLEGIRASSSTGGFRAPNEPLHILQSCKYLQAPETAYRFNRDGGMVTSDDPARRLQTGLFCDSCQSTANDCLWKCSQCNEGDWGFCNRCVNQGRCCTHALLPICRITRDSPLASPTRAYTNVPNGTPNDCSVASALETESYKTLSFTTNCDICTHPIPASTLRFHCLVCNDGDYDICANCYLRLVAIGKIRKENGHNGWRRCIKGHRMIVVGFDEHEEGQRRVIVRDLVGGRALKDDHFQQALSSSSPFSISTAASATAIFNNTDSTPGSPISPTGPGIASPEFAPGDWLWKEGSERRKKASRLRPWPLSGDRDRTAVINSSSSEPSTPNTPIFAPAAAPSVTSSSRRYPPDGGVGLVAHALWSWYPEDGVKDELMFPRGAEITEAENINDDWYWGCYAGLTGLFPGSHVEVVGEII